MRRPRPGQLPLPFAEGPAAPPPFRPSLPPLPMPGTRWRVAPGVPKLAGQVVTITPRRSLGSIVWGRTADGFVGPFTPDELLPVG